jgi:hypothetical protein
MRKLAMSLFASLLMAGAAAAQPACPAPPVAGTHVELKAAIASPELGPARLMLDQAATVTLHPGNDVRFVIAPEKPGAAGSFGGMLAVDVREAGTYQVALSAGAWLDMVQDGAAVASTAHEHGAECSGLRKMVSFPLKPGRHVIQLSGNKEDTIRVVVSRK